MKNPALHNEEHYIAFCDCGEDAVLLSRWRDDEWKEIFLSMWGCRYPHSVAWRDRLRHIWRIITVGYPYEDDVVLNPDSARELGKKLIEYADNWIEKAHG